MVSEEDDIVQEIQHVKQASKAKNYPGWMQTIPNTESARESPKNPATRREYTPQCSVPYIKGISERLQRAFKSHEVTIVHKPVSSLRSQLVHVKDKTGNLKKCTVYHIHCDQCNKQYVGETSRVLETRIKEHLSRDSSAVHEHCQLTGHSVDSSKTKVLSTESNTFKRRIREAIEIRLRKPSLNRDNGFELASIYNTFLGPLRPL